ncbi:MAG: bacillithiol biosynthesis cysteine-adding enzyme BshC, partial [Sphingobacteriales bacterium]
SKFPNYNFVPVYWMATEDHDFAEINHTYLFNNKIEWTPEVSGSTGKIKTDGIEETIEQLKEILGQSPFAETAISKIEDAYIKEDNLASATRTLAYSLFGNEGLVVIDADQKELKKVFAPYIEDDILNERSHSSILTAKNKLEKHYKLPVNPREINFFYLQDNFRERIVKNENHEFEVLNSSIKFSEEELTTEIKNNPQYFSPNVAMRPLYQELILPNLAYIGGPSEIAYWFELCDTFIEFGQKLPVLLLRDCLMLVDKTSLKKIEKLGFKLEDAFKDKDDLIKDYVKSNSTMQLSLTEEVIAIENTFEKIKEKAVAIEPNLNKTVEGEKTKALNHLKSLEQKLLRAEKQKHETAINQIEGVKEKLFPNNVPQERKENFLTWYIKNGDDFIANIISTTNPLDKVFKILY